jgi:uncharacterized protein
MEVPWRELSKAALRGVIEAFVLQEGTDYGGEYTLDQKVEAVQQQLKRGEAAIVFDPETETTNIVSKRS